MEKIFTTNPLFLLNFSPDYVLMKQGESSTKIKMDFSWKSFPLEFVEKQNLIKVLYIS